MFDDLATHFYHSVVGNFEDYIKELRSTTSGLSRDAIKAINAATALYHFREHLPTSFSLSRRQIATTHCPDYDLLGDVVNAAKHKEITFIPNPKFKYAKDIVEQVVITFYNDEEGEYKNVEKAVIINLTDGTRKNLEEVLVNVMNFWQTYLHSIGIIQDKKIYTIASNIQPKSRAESNDGRMDIQLVKGLRFKQTCLLQEFNYSTGKVEPIDLTGSDFRMNIYKPPVYEIGLSITNSKTGETFKKVVSLSEAETKHLDGLTTEEEKNSYLTDNSTIKEAFFQLAKEAGVPLASSTDANLETSLDEEN